MQNEPCHTDSLGFCNAQLGSSSSLAIKAAEEEQSNSSTSNAASDFTSADNIMVNKVKCMYFIKRMEEHKRN